MADFSNQVLKLQKIFEHKGLTLSFAESCTGGLLSATIAAQSGVSKFFKGSVVSYAREVKNEILGVPSDLLQTHGEVSEAVALAMARGAKSKLRTDWAVSITGVAGPTGGTDKKPVGMVCFGFVGPDFEKTIEKRFGSKPRTEIQSDSVATALENLLNFLK